MSTATPSLEQLLETILALPLSDRAVIADVVADSLHPPDPEIEREILEVVRQRLAAYRAGEIKAIPADEVFRQIDEEFGFS
jgi:putative addiction module component (TIGR02574 family)